MRHRSVEQTLAGLGFILAAIASRTTFVRRLLVDDRDIAETGLSKRKPSTRHAAREALSNPDRNSARTQSEHIKPRATAMSASNSSPFNRLLYLPNAYSHVSRKGPFSVYWGADPPDRPRHLAVEAARG